MKTGKKYILLPMLLWVLTVTTGCTFVSESNELPETIRATVNRIRQEEKKAISGKGETAAKQEKSSKGRKLSKTQQVIEEYQLSRKLVSAFLKDDGKNFVDLLPAKLRQEFNVEKFKVTRQAVASSMGEPVSFRYVTALEMTSVTPHIWAIRFSRISRDEKEEYTSEMLFRVITGYLDGKPYIIGFNFF